MVHRTGNPFRPSSVTPSTPAEGNDASTSASSGDPRLPDRAALTAAAHGSPARPVRDRDAAPLGPQRDGKQGGLGKLPDAIAGRIASFLPVQERMSALEGLAQARGGDGNHHGSSEAVKVILGPAPSRKQLDELWTGTAVEHRSPALILELVKRGHFTSLEQVPTAGLNPADWQACVDAGLARLSQVPEPMRTLDICKAAIARDAATLSEVPMNVRSASRALCELAVSRNRGGLDDVPTEFQDAAMFELAVGADGDNLRFVPPSQRTAPLCAVAVRTHPSALEHVPLPLRTAPLCEAAFRQNKNVFEFFPESLKTTAHCHAAVRDAHYMLEHVPKTKRDTHVYALALLGSRDVQYLFGQGLKPDDLGDVRDRALAINPQLFMALKL